MQGSLGQDHANPAGGQTWQEAAAFISAVTKIMEAQSADSNQPGKLHPPAVFTYPPRGWRFNVYLKALTDPAGQSSVNLTPGQVNQRYSLTMFIVQDGSSALVKAGTTNGVFSQKAYDAVTAFMARISDGIGWHFTQYNGQATGTLPKAAAPPATSTSPTVAPPAGTPQVP